MSLSAGDAVSNDVVGMYRALSRRGVDVRVFPFDHAKQLEMKIIFPNDVEEFLADPKDIFIYHFSGAWPPGEALLKSLKCIKVVKYHNVTPPQFFSGINMEYQEICLQGRERIPFIASSSFLWGDSAYNVSEFIGAGFDEKATSIIPPFHHISELLAVAPDKKWMNLLQDGRRNIIVVGRLVPNKNHPFLIQAFDRLRRTVPNARLVIVGGRDERLRAYTDEVDGLIASFNLENVVLQTDKVSSAALAAIYRSAHLFAISSLHEGFCVPLVEAMAFGVPIVALATSAIPETLGDAGWLVAESTPEALARSMIEALQDQNRSRLAKRAGLVRYRRFFSQAAIEDRFLSVIAPMLPRRQIRPRAIHQFHSGTAYGDAVTNGMMLIQKQLHELGFVSEIYAEHIAAELAGFLKHYSAWAPSPDDVLLLHHSMGHDLEAWVEGLPATKILIYHNITPAEFFPPDSPFRYYAVKGRELLSQFRSGILAAIADSDLNAEELFTCGYKDVEVIPLLFDVASLRQRPWNDELVQRESATFTVLFVGRVAPNKCQHDLVEVAAWLRQILKRPFQLVCVGGYDADDPYFRRVMAEIEANGLSDCVRFPGKISESDLYAWYRAADVFLSMSEHEGFGVPFIEAMAFDLPVIAYQSSNIAATLGGAGLMFTEKNHPAIAALLKILSEDRALRQALVIGQRSRLLEFDRQRQLVQLSTFLRRQGICVPQLPAESTAERPLQLRYQVEGPFETSYSLAQVNREVAMALNRIEPGYVGVFATEGPGDYQPDHAAVNAIPGLNDLWRRGRKGSRADVVIRNLYPPRVSDMDGVLNFLYFAWEESELNPAWVDSFNRCLDGMPVLSRYVKKVLLDNGVSVPSIAAGCGIDHVVRAKPSPYPGSLGEGFRFLHISSCFPRKGVDVLLKAFAEAFSPKDKVTLVIKTFRNPHNKVADQIQQLRATRTVCPDIVLIEEDLPLGQMVDLYRRCHAFVAPTRGEGFGLPMAEAMWFRLPVITTAYGGQSDFCTDKTAWLVDYRFQPAQTHMGLYNSVWVEPDPADLIRQMRAVRWADQSALEPRLIYGRALIEEKFTWDRCAERLRMLERKVLARQPLAKRRLRLGWVSSWNAKCGIASYSSFLIGELDPARFEVRIFASKNDATLAADGPNVNRCWTDCFDEIDELLGELKNAELDAIVVQHNFGFISMKAMTQLIEFAHDCHIPIFFTFHSTKDVDKPGLKFSLGSVAKELKGATRLLVHGVDDLNRLKGWGLVENASILPHGVLSRPKADMKLAREATGIPVNAKVIATYGFILPHKGFEQLIEAFPSILKREPDAFLLMVNALYPSWISDETLARCKKLIASSGISDRIMMITEFLSDEGSLSLLGAANLVVFPYQETSESSSAAVRFGLASHRPVVCSPLSIFDDVSSVVLRLPGTSPSDIADGIAKLLGDKKLLHAKAEDQERWLRSASWRNVSARLAGLIIGSIDQEIEDV